MTDNVVSLRKTEKQEKEERKETILEVMDESRKIVGEGGGSSLVCLWIDDEGLVNSSWVGSNPYELVGMLETAKLHLQIGDDDGE
mgnify:CR=1 FL=1